MYNDLPVYSNVPYLYRKLSGRGTVYTAICLFENRKIRVMVKVEITT